MSWVVAFSKRDSNLSFTPRQVAMLKGKVKALTAKGKEADESTEKLNAEIQAQKAKVSKLEAELSNASKNASASEEANALKKQLAEVTAQSKAKDAEMSRVQAELAVVKDAASKVYIKTQYCFQVTQS